jgi:uncharacterized protein YjiS (DUF1127 family)
MESGMRESDDFYFLTFDHVPLTPEQLDHLKRSAERSAKQARAQALRGLFVGIATALQAAAIYGRDMVRNRWSAYATWRQRREAIRELRALDDRSLKDLGLHRSEIESVVYGRDSSRMTEGKVAAFLFHKPYARQSSVKNRSPKQMIKKSAA